jgi:hypothetical protein
VAGWLGIESEAGTAQPASTGALEEYMLVALAAIYRCNENWLDQIVPFRVGKIEELLGTSFADRFPDTAERKRVAETLARALSTFDGKFGPPNVFSSDVVDRHAIVAFYAAMAADIAGPQAVVEPSAPTSLHSATTPAA